jgi:hypothetical protein
VKVSYKDNLLHVRHTKCVYKTPKGWIDNNTLWFSPNDSFLLDGLYEIRCGKCGQWFPTGNTKKIQDFIKLCELAEMDLPCI